MASAKLFGCAINVEAKEEDVGGDRSIAGEVSRSGIQLDGEAMSLSVCLPPFNQRESNPYFHFLDSNSDSGSASMDSEPDLRNCFIDFFDRESYDVETAGEFFISTNQRLTTWDDFNIWGFHDAEGNIDLGLGIGIGSGSGQIRGDSGGIDLEVTGNGELGTGRVEIGDNLFGEEEAMVADEELEWEDLQNAISWVQEPVQVSLFSMEEEEEVSVASGDVDLDWEVLFPVNNVGVFEEDSGLMDLEYDVFLASIDEYGENHGDYNAVLEQMFDNDSGITGSPPASKRAVDDLPVVEITTEELGDRSMVCAICKDEIVVEEKVKKLPCRHYYHGECIIPWLGIRNTCPVCRYELPTDDNDYERNRRSQRRGSSGLASELMSE